MYRAFVFALAVVLTSAANLWADKVFVAPFTESDNRQADWINRSLQQSLADDLALTKSVEVVDKAAGAAFVISGNVQRVNGELRVSGRVQDAAGKSVGGFKATGPERQLFAIEDAIAVQVKQVVAPPQNPATASSTTSPAGTVAQIQTPFAPANYGSFEGSDLQRSMRDPRSLRDLVQPTVIYQPTPVYVPQSYNYGVNNGMGYYSPYYNSGWYGGFPSNIVVINKGGNCPPVNCPPGGSNGGFNFPSANGQAIRAAATWQGNPPSAMTHTMSGPQLVPSGGPQLVPGGHRR